MSWETKIVKIIRHLVNDLDETSYTDDRLQETAVVSAQLINSVIDFENTYTINVDANTISPDPTDLNDDDFINLTALKAACIILRSEAKTYGAQSYKIVDGPSTIETSSAFSATKAISDQMCEDVQRAIIQFQMGNSRAGEAIMTPYTQSGIGTGIYRAFN